MRESGSGLVRRTAWLMLGGAIGLAAALLGLSLAQVVAPVVGLPSALVTVACLLPVPLLGLVPGARELEVTAAHGMLGITAELVTPEHPRAEHRLRCVAWVTLHLGLGLVAAVLLLGLLPGAAALIWGSVSGNPILGLPASILSAPLTIVGALMIGVAASVGSLALVWGLGRLARRIVPAFLGPTATDLLLLVESRLAAEAGHTRLARELHDGIGHALTIIAVQAAAGRRGRPPGHEEPALEIIETTAQQALDELDSMLGVLRDAPATVRPEPDLDSVGTLAAVYRSGGLEVETNLGNSSGLDPAVSRTAYQIVAEALANAQRHAGVGAVGVRVDPGPATVTIEVTSPLGGARIPRPGRASGRGLDGVRERVRLFGGSVDAGPRTDSGTWVLRATLPTTVRPTTVHHG